MRYEETRGAWQVRRPAQEEAARVPGGCDTLFDAKPHVPGTISYT